MELKDNNLIPSEQFSNKEYIYSRLDKIVDEQYKSLIDSNAIINLFIYGAYDGLRGNSFKNVTASVKGKITDVAIANSNALAPIYELGYQFGNALNMEFRLKDPDNQMLPDYQMAILAATSEQTIIHIRTFFDPNYDVERYRETNRDDSYLKQFLNPNKLN